MRESRDSRSQRPDAADVDAATRPVQRADQPAGPARVRLDETALATAGPEGLERLEAAVVQCRQAVQRAQDAAAVRDIAAHGVQGSGAQLPHLDTIQRSFGHHDVSSTHAHVGGAAGHAAAAIGARAYATGDNVAFDGAPNLHTAAHEAAHVVQQRAGVHLSGGVGAAGDSYEQHADAVADAVVRGQSAATLLDRMAPHRGDTTSVQRAPADSAVQALARPGAEPSLTAPARATAAALGARASRRAEPTSDEAPVQMLGRPTTSIRFNGEQLQARREFTIWGPTPPIPEIPIPGAPIPLFVRFEPNLKLIFSGAVPTEQMPGGVHDEERGICAPVSDDGGTAQISLAGGATIRLFTGVPNAVEVYVAAVGTVEGAVRLDGSLSAGTYSLNIGINGFIAGRTGVRFLNSSRLDFNWEFGRIGLFVLTGMRLSNQEENAFGEFAWHPDLVGEPDGLIPRITRWLEQPAGQDMRVSQTIQAIESDFSYRPGHQMARDMARVVQASRTGQLENHRPGCTAAGELKRAISTGFEHRPRHQAAAGVARYLQERGG